MIIFPIHNATPQPGLTLYMDTLPVIVAYQDDQNPCASKSCGGPLADLFLHWMHSSLSSFLLISLPQPLPLLLPAGCSAPAIPCTPRPPALREFGGVRPCLPGHARAATC